MAKLKHNSNVKIADWWHDVMRWHEMSPEQRKIEFRAILDAENGIVRNERGGIVSVDGITVMDWLAGKRNG